VLSPLDDYPVHQIPELMRHPGTSDRNFYDRYYFNAYSPGTGMFLIAGLGQYPNLGVTDAFALLRHGDEHLVVRASKELGPDRMDTTIGPFHLEVLEGLKRLRLTLDPTGHGLSFDLTFTGAVPAHLEPRHYKRELDRVVFDTQRFAQTGSWTGTLTHDTTTHEVTGWLGNRDRSWGIRPVGEPEPLGRKAGGGRDSFFWIYSVMQFTGYAIFVIMQEDAQGRRVIEEAVRVYAGGTTEWLGRPEHTLTFAPGTRDVTSASMTFDKPGAEPMRIDVDLLLPSHLGVATGYGHLEEDWRHGMWQGTDPVVQGVRRDVTSFELPERMFCPADILSRFHLHGRGEKDTGTGLFEVAAIGPHPGYGFTSFLDTAA
jgi:hypothetical protein